MSKLHRILSVVFTSAFAGGCLVVSLVMVPDWRRMSPDEFLDWFSGNGPRLGLTMFPLDVAGSLFTVLAFVDSLKRGSETRAVSGLSSLCILATVFLLPVYFAKANARMLNRSIEATEVADELRSWSRWQWLRTFLAILAMVFGGWSLIRK